MNSCWYSAQMNAGEKKGKKCWTRSDAADAYQWVTNCFYYPKFSWDPTFWHMRAASLTYHRATYSIPLSVASWHTESNNRTLLLIKLTYSEFNLVINPFYRIWSSLGRSDGESLPLQGQFRVCGWREQHFSPPLREGESLPVSLSALIAPHLVPVFSFTRLLPCPTQPTHASQHHPTRPPFLLLTYSFACTLVNSSFAQGHWNRTHGVKRPQPKQTGIQQTSCDNVVFIEFRWD